MQQLTVWNAIPIVLIAALLLFWLFAPTGWVARQLNWMGGGIQWFVSKLKGLFTKK